MPTDSNAQPGTAAPPGNYLIRIVAGAMKGTEFPLKKAVTTMGRSSESDIVVHDNLVSRVHCRISWNSADRKWSLEDLESTNGTWLVGQKVSKKVFIPEKTPGRVGNTLFEIYNVISGEDTQSISIPFIAYSMQPETFKPTSAAEKKPGDAVRTAEEHNRILSAIYKFQNSITAITNPDKLHGKIVGTILDIIPGDYAFLILYNLEKGIFESVAGRSPSGPVEEVDKERISKTIIEFVKENRESVLSIDPQVEKKFTEDGKLKQVNRSTMCVPMIINQQLTGMVYATLTSPERDYDENDLRLMTVIGHTAGLALENIRLLEFNLKNERLVATGTTAAGLSHYIKNILAGLDGSLNLLQMAVDEKDFNLAGESLGILSKNHRRLGNLVLDLLNLTSEQKLSLRMGDLNTVIKDVADLFTAQLKHQNIDLIVDPNIKNLPLYAEFDNTGIHRVLLNLITNAEHAIMTKRERTGDDSTGSIVIDAKFDDTNEFIVISVTDSGIGIDMAEADKIFELFFTSKGTAGTGLGLAVSKRIVDAHSGTISATGEKGKSCTISFTLPLQRNETNTSTQAIKKMI